MHHPQIAQRVFNTPLLVEPAKAAAFLTGLGPRIAGQEIAFAGLGLNKADVVRAAARAQASLLAGNTTRQTGEQPDRPYALTDGVAVIPIAGTLVHRGAWIGQSSGLTSYEGIATQIDTALGDPEVRGIALEIDSFGGEVAGAFDLADRIRAARDVKPVQAFVADHALSAGYALASQADRIVLSRTGAVGSIGVVLMHTDMSGMLAAKGLAVTLVYAGAHKADGNPYEPLPEPVRDRLQAELEDLRALFAGTVAAGRGDRLTSGAALATEAAVVRGTDAVTAGLADAVVDPRSAFAGFVSELNARGAAALPKHSPLTIESQQETPMTEQTDAAPSVAETPTIAELAPAAENEAPTAAAPDADAIRAEAAEVAQICAQAGRLGLSIDAADSVRRGLKPDALRTKILGDLAAAGDAAGIHAAAPAATPPAESPIVAAARRAAGTAER
ncbi:protein C [Aliiruegeria haliotis]|uniref:Protein C n=1 Tax=Aliiruegeria haliotis TaxID=1280846 RepID=A0A2T0RQW2_9RHOB|nr:S49 family peptidase [Aliiruegeria haliotis]PRY23522.1 protein C [Aliiruegeria haliotis]